jgi:hypothetical protein
MTEAPGVRVGAVIAVAVVAGFLVWLFIIRDRGGDASKFEDGQPTEISESESGVGSLASAAAHPVYWVGTQPDTKLEATLLSSGNTYVRYLTPDAAIGDSNPDFTTVGTYPVPNAFKALKNVSIQSGSVVKKTPDKGLVVTNTSNPTSVYIAYRGQDLQVEVYDPNPKQALRFATSGAVTPID